MLSMTSYACAVKSSNLYNIQLIIRSSNFKYLDIICNLPSLDIFLEEKIKRLVKNKVKRGRVEIFLLVKEKNIFKEEILKKYFKKLDLMAKKYAFKLEINIDSFLNFYRGELTRYILEDKNLIIQTFKEVLRRLIDFKKKAGEEIRKQMQKNLEDLLINFEKIKKTYEKIKFEIKEEKEISEEITLGIFYLKKLKSIIESKKEEPKGKVLDFLTQEILREINTLASKTTDPLICDQALQAKINLERIREQAQNVE